MVGQFVLLEEHVRSYRLYVYLYPYLYNNFFENRIQEREGILYKNINNEVIKSRDKYHFHNILTLKFSTKLHKVY